MFQPPKSLGFLSPLHTPACTVLEATQADVRFPRPALVQVVWRAQGVITAERLGVPPARNCSCPHGEKPEHDEQGFCAWVFLIYTQNVTLAAQANSVRDFNWVQFWGFLGLVSSQLFCCSAQK